MKENRPSAFDKLISGGGAYETTAHSGPWMDNDWMFMAKGYVRTAELALLALALALDGCSRHYRDQILYPVVLLCRHSLELALKYSIDFGTRWQSQSSCRGYSLGLGIPPCKNLVT